MAGSAVPFHQHPAFDHRRRGFERERGRGGNDIGRGERALAENRGVVIADPGDAVEIDTSYPAPLISKGLGSIWGVGYAQTGTFATNTQAMQNVLGVLPFRLGATRKVIGLGVLANSAVGTARVGIYSAVDGNPGALVADAGQVNLAVTATAGYRLVTMNVTLPAGLYFICATAAFSSGTLYCVNQTNPNWAPMADNAGSVLFRAMRSPIGQTFAPTSALPATFPGATLESGQAGLIPHTYIRFE